MNEFKILMIFMISMGAIQTTYAQENESSRELKISDEEKIILFSGFSIAVIGIFVFLARDIILRKKRHTINNSMNQKKIEPTKNIIQIGEMIMKKLEREEIVSKKENSEKK